MEFDGWKVDRVSGEISRGDRAARLPQQPLRILIELFDHAGAVVTRDQLVKVLWPAGIVDFDNGLNVAMRKLRVALDDVGDTPRYIETLPRVGYRFIGRPGESAASVPSTEVRRLSRARIALVLAIIALAAGVGLSWWLWSGRDTSRHIPSERAQELYLDGLQLRSRRDIDTTNAVDREVRGGVAGRSQLSRSMGGVWNGDLHRRHPAETDTRRRHTQGARRCRASHRARSW